MSVNEIGQNMDEQPLLPLREHYIEKTKSLKRMAAGMVHIFNNRFASIIGYLELAMDDLSAGSSAMDYLAISLKEAKLAVEVTSQLVSYLGQSVTRCVKFDLSRLCREYLDNTIESLPPSVSLKQIFPDSGPIIHADPHQIALALRNLIENAGEAGPHRSVEIQVSITKARSTAIASGNAVFPHTWEPICDDYVCIEVSDSGNGIDSAVIRNIFDPFYSSKFTGRGLGLPVVLGIVLAHSGAITVESQLARGSCFRIFLPVDQCQSSQNLIK